MRWSTSRCTDRSPRFYRKNDSARRKNNSARRNFQSQGLKNPRAELCLLQMQRGACHEPARGLLHHHLLAVHHDVGGEGKVEAEGPVVREPEL